ncbi:ATP-binding protein [Pseudonocardia zijingensis]|uniref:ATP-binding protein n=1 Tax=Pseudonocardia zijingensis TaxID=153376 RepID=UPI0031D8EE10
MRSRSLQPVPGSARSAREFVREACHDWTVEDEMCEDAMLVATELVANVVDHAGTSCVVTIDGADSWLRIEVEDGYPCSLPTSPRIDVSAARGRGLLVVAGVSRAWGVRELPHGKSVWALLGAG